MNEIKPPFIRRNLSKKVFNWGQDIEIVFDVAQRHGCHLEPSTDEYIIAKIIGDGVRLVLYPHKTSAKNYHLRVRDENSKNPEAAHLIVNHLDLAAGNNCTFQMKLQSKHDLINRAKKFIGQSV